MSQNIAQKKKRKVQLKQQETKIKIQKKKQIELKDCTRITITKDELGIEQADETREGKEQRPEEVV